MKKKGFSIIVVIFSFVTLFALAAFVVDTSIYANQRAELQKAVEMTALSAASRIALQLDPATFNMIYPTEAEAQGIVTSTFDLVKDPQLLEFARLGAFDGSAQGCDVNIDSRAVKVYATVPAKAYFSSILGFSFVTLSAQAAAINMPYNLTRAAGVTMNLVPPVGTAGLPAGTSQAENVTNSADQEVISLGAGGSIVLTFDKFIADNPGPDIMVKESGHKEGYFLYAGIADNNGITKWTNISCTGVPLGARIGEARDDAVKAYSVDADFGGGTQAQTKFYGSAMFDLGATCANGEYSQDLKYANRLYIVDDNEEDGFTQENYLPTLGGVPEEVAHHTMLLGGHSSITPGADIDAVDVMSYSRLIPVREYNDDNDGDGLISFIEDEIDTRDTNVDSDGDGLDDDAEYNGWGQSPFIYFTSPSVNDDLGINF